jgi:protease-4
MRSRLLGCFTTFAILLLIVSVALNVFFAMVHLASEPERGIKKLSEEVVAAADATVAPAKIVQIDIAGVISNDAAVRGSGGAGLVESVKRELHQAVEDTGVKAIVIRVDSPGGEVTASDTLYHAVQEAKAQKPVIIYMDSMAASGGYYLSCGASKIVANENTWTGSIGVIVQGMGYGEALAKLGLEMRVFRSGNFKDTFYGQRKMTPEEDTYVQNMVMQTYERFVNIVSTARNIPVEKLKAEIADGRVFSGVDALKVGLVDKLGYVETAYQLAKDLAGVKDAEVVRYAHSGSVLDLIGLSTKAKASTPDKIELDVTSGLIPKLQAGKCYLLPASYVQ